MPEVIIRVRADDDLDDDGRALVEVHSVDGYPVEGVAEPSARLGADRADPRCAGCDVVGHVMEKDHPALSIYRALGGRQIGTAMHDTGHGTKVPSLLLVHPVSRARLRG